MRIYQVIHVYDRQSDVHVIANSYGQEHNNNNEQKLKITRASRDGSVKKYQKE